MTFNRLSGIALATAIAIAGLGLASSDAYAKGGNGNSEKGGGKAGSSYLAGTCSTADVFSGAVNASSCGNFSGNDSQVGFLDALNDGTISSLAGYTSESSFAEDIAALDGTWSLFGKSDEGGDKVNDIDEDLQSGEWSFTEALEDPFVVVLKASGYYSAYLFQNFDEAIDSGQFSVEGITKDSDDAEKFAALSHMSVYSFAPRMPEEKPADIPEPTTMLGLLAVAGVGYRLKRSANA
jgi:hypothetical protein